jgi:hypothetical protein
MFVTLSWTIATLHPTPIGWLPSIFFTPWAFRHKFPFRNAFCA